MYACILLLCELHSRWVDAWGLLAGAEGELHLEGSVKSTKWKLHWLPNIAELVPLRLVDFDHLITKKKLEEGDALEDFVNKNSVCC